MDNSELAARIYAQQRNEATLRRVLGKCCTRSARHGTLFPFLVLTFAFGLTAVAMLYKPGCAISAADTSPV